MIALAGTSRVTTAAGADQRVLANHHIRQDGCSRSNRRTFLDQRDLDFPILLRLERPCLARRTRKRVVDERDIVSDKDLVFDRHAFTNEGMARYFAPTADFGILLNLDKGPNFCIVTDLAAIEVDEFRELHVLPNLTSGAMQRYTWP